MAKGKYRRSRKNAQQRSQQGANRATFVEKEAERDVHTATETVNNGGGMSSRWRRFKGYAKSSSFTDWCIASFTFVLAAAAIYQFVIMDWQLDVMRKDQRAWITVAQRGDPTIAVGAVPSSSLTITDTGKTPATQIVGHFYVEIVPNGDNPHFEAQTMHTTMISGIAIPNAPQVIAASRRTSKIGKPDEGEALPLTTDEKTSLDDGKSWIAVHGIVWYDDVFKTRHWIKFCFWTDLKLGDYGSRSCVAYNSSDGN